MTTNDYQWLPLTTNDCQWLPMITNDYQWLPMTTNDYILAISKPINDCFIQCYYSSLDDPVNVHNLSFSICLLLLLSTSWKTHWLWFLCFVCCSTRVCHALQNNFGLHICMCLVFSFGEVLHSNSSMKNSTQLTCWQIPIWIKLQH